MTSYEGRDYKEKDDDVMQFEVEQKLPRLRRRRDSGEIDALLAALAGPSRAVISVPITSMPEAQRFAMKVRMAAKSRYGFGVTQRVRVEEGKLYLQRKG